MEHQNYEVAILEIIVQPSPYKAESPHEGRNFSEVGGGSVLNVLNGLNVLNV